MNHATRRPISSVADPILAWRLVVGISLLFAPSASHAHEPVPGPAQTAADPTTVKNIAAIVTTYYQNSHADTLVSRLLEGYTLDGQGERPRLKLVSLYTDQVPANDKSRKLARDYQFPIYDNVADALTLGTGKLAVDGVLLVCEHGEYPKSDTGQTQYPKRRLFAKILEVFQASQRSVPVFIDKHLADNWEDAQWIYDMAREHRVPLMAGSSLPQTWRRPAIDLPRGTRLKEVLALSYHTLDAYGFHGLEMLESIAERRQGGETGIRAVRCLKGPEVWAAGKRGEYDPELLQAALARLELPQGGDRPLEEKVEAPVLFTIEYQDGLRASMLTLNGLVAEWTVAWRSAEDQHVDATLFWTQDWRPFMHFSNQMAGIESLMHTGEPAWPVERTLLTSGLLDSLLISQREGGRRIETPHLKIAYETHWDWSQPPPAPPDRPLDGQ